MGKLERIPLNPFEPDREASPELFAGRDAELDELRRALVETARHNSHSIGIVGERGIGKTSLLNYLYRVAPSLPEFEEPQTLPAIVTCSLGSCGSIEDIATTIIDEIYRSTRLNTKLRSRLEQVFERIQSVSFSGFGIRIADVRSKKDLVLTFHQVLQETIEELSKEFSGLVVFLDETDRVCELKAFGDFLKNTCEQLRRNDVENFMFLLTVLPSSFDNLRMFNPSVLRVFRWSELAPFSTEEVEELVEGALERGYPKKELKPEFIETLMTASDGIPSFVQHIAYYAFEHDHDDKLTAKDCWNGLYGTDRKSGALQQLEIKYFDDMYVDVFKTPQFDEVLSAFARSKNGEMTLGELRTQLKKTTPARVGGVVSRLYKRGLLVKHPDIAATYKLPSNSFRIFLRVQLEKRS